MRLALLFLLTGFPCFAADSYSYFLAGNPGDVVRTTRPGQLLMGGGGDVDEAFRWMIARSGGGDFLILRASGGDAYNPYIMGLGGVDSVETLVIRDRAAASHPFVLDKVRRAEAIFLAGGDQWNYVRLWQDTPLQQALQQAAARCPFGGTSAGLAVLGEWVFGARFDTIDSAAALRNPYDPKLAIEPALFHIPALAGLITDSHVQQRDRMGRLLSFLARIASDQRIDDVKGIGVSERTALGVEGETVKHFGGGTAYLVRASHRPEVCRAGEPLTLTDVSVYRLGPGSTFDLRLWRGAGGTAYTLSAVGGRLISSQESGAVY